MELWINSVQINHAFWTWNDWNLAKISKKLQIRWNFKLTVFKLTVPDMYMNLELTRMHSSRMHTTHPVVLICWGEVNDLSFLGGGGPIQEEVILSVGRGGSSVQEGGQWPFLPGGGCPVQEGDDPAWGRWSCPVGRHPSPPVTMWPIPWCIWCHPPPWGWTDRCFWKHNLRSLRYAGGNKS